MILLIEKLSNAMGAPGFEDEVVGIIKDELAGDFHLEEDKMRNLVIKRKNHDGNKPVVMLDGHSDEVAFMVQHLLPNGQLKFLPLGGWVPANVAASKVWVRTEEGQYIPGLVGSTPPHFLKNKSAEASLDDMHIDVGATSLDELINVFKIDVGAPVVPHAVFDSNDLGIMMGKAFDNRLGCGCVIETLRALEGLDLPVDVVGVISTQEEIGTRGARVNATRVKPDVALVFEGTPADDTFRSPLEAQGKIRGGVQIRHLDRSMVASPRLVRLAKDTAKKYKISFQQAVRAGGGTNAGSIHIEEEAVPSIVLGTPVRYAHTNYGISAIEDYQATINLAVSMIKDLTPEDIANL